VNILANAVIIILIAYTGYIGFKRGMVLVGLELISFFIATVVAVAAYQPLGDLLHNGIQVTTALGNIAAFIIAWTITEVSCALAIRFGLLPHIGHDIHLSTVNRIGGSILGAFKASALITLALVVFGGLPVPANIKQPVMQAFMPTQLLAASGDLPRAFGSGLAQDLTDSFNFFTVPAEPESDKRIDLGYTTTKVVIDSRAENDMLVMLNNERTSRGLKALTMNTEARAVARVYSADMFARGFFSHVDPDGKNPFDRMKAGGVKYASAGENLALAPTLKQAHDGLMKSPGHRANILSAEYRTVGIGIMDGGPYGLMITQDFTD
jgi:uncharacterized protein YkwD/uncharacterized membrane protein required for colicin V production